MEPVAVGGFARQRSVCCTALMFPVCVAVEEILGGGADDAAGELGPDLIGDAAVAALDAGDAVDVLQEVVFVGVYESGLLEVAAVGPEPGAVLGAVAGVGVAADRLDDADEEGLEEGSGLVDGGVTVSVRGGGVGLAEMVSESLEV